MIIRFIGGMWRRIEGNSIKSFSTFEEAVEDKTCGEDFGPQAAADDIAQQPRNQKILVPQGRYSYERAL